MKKDIGLFLIALLFLLMTLLHTASAQKEIVKQNYLHDRSFWMDLCVRHVQHKKAE